MSAEQPNTEQTPCFTCHRVIPPGEYHDCDVLTVEGAQQLAEYEHQADQDRRARRRAQFARRSR